MSRNLPFYSLVSQAAPMLSHKLLTEVVVLAGTGPALISKAERSREKNASSVTSSILDPLRTNWHDQAGL